MKPSMLSKLDQLANRLVELDELLMTEGVTADMDNYRKMTREHAELSPLVAVSQRFAVAFVPAALLFHLGIVLTIGYFFPSLPLLLLLLPWDAIGRRLDPPP